MPQVLVELRLYCTMLVIAIILMAWHRGNIVGHITEVNLHCARLVLELVTIFGR